MPYTVPRLVVSVLGTDMQPRISSDWNPTRRNPTVALLDGRKTTQGTEPTRGPEATAAVHPAAWQERKPSGQMLWTAELAESHHAHSNTHVWLACSLPDLCRNICLIWSNNSNHCHPHTIRLVTKHRGILSHICCWWQPTKCPLGSVTANNIGWHCLCRPPGACGSCWLTDSL